ncbi:nucleoside deaminase [Halorientalis sp. IM1011]|uniref:amidohydrolase family protein n=1 Tax=Halorientalis sp. IM1011 TaxID=1932360 RepID=UPI00097CD70A|nr:amidohydrolase family protein [Halorientalis sp. IM1011]AQL44123.1 nucleoside deaminase [Halorientalis sp. IM1011]
MSDRRTIEGTILRGKEFEATEGRVIVADGQIAGIEEEPVESDDIVVPAFVNAHTHIGDSIAKEAGEGLDLDELVAPPDGLKHRLLREASHEETVAAMERSLSFMEGSGTAACIGFREGGVEGVRAMAEAVEGLDIESVTLGREEIEAMEAADGFGASGARDGEFGRERTATREAGKLFGIHAGERDPDDINGALDLDPDFLVHMVHPERIHLERVADRDVPIVVCPRSNLVTGVGTPDIAELAEHTTVALGTDNVMLNSPSMFREMEFAAKLSEVSARYVLKMATHHGAEIADLNCGVIEEDRDARLFVLDGDSDNLTGYQNPVRAVVRRAGIDDVREVVLETPD